MNILVTGSAGFIGMHVVRKLCSESRDKVVSLDNINDYYDLRLKLDRVKSLGFSGEKGNISSASTIHDNCFFYEADVSDRGSLEKIVSENNIELIIHLAAQAGVRYSFENPALYLQANIQGTFNILECCKKHNVKRLIYASSSSVYGNAKKFPLCEDDNTSQPISLYAASKKSCEAIVHSYTQNYNISAVGLRFFTVYGPWGRPDMAPYIFTSRISEGQEISVFNNGNMSRDFTFIDDIVNAIVKLAAKEDAEQGHLIFNIGNGNPVGLMDFISVIEKNLDAKAKMKFREIQPGDVKKTWADTSKLQQYIDWKPKTDINSGIKRFIDWYKKYQDEKKKTHQ